MQKKFCIPFACSVLTLFALCAPMFGQDQARTKPLKLQLVASASALYSKHVNPVPLPLSGLEPHKH